MDPDFPQGRAAFVFSDPDGRRWPRLRLALLIAAVVAFIAAVFFVQTLFVTPQLRLPFALHQLKSQLKALQRSNPAGQLPPNVPLWQKFIAARAAARKQTAPNATATPAVSHKAAGAKCDSAFIRFRRRAERDLAYHFRRWLVKDPPLTRVVPSKDSGQALRRALLVRDDRRCDDPLCSSDLLRSVCTL